MLRLRGAPQTHSYQSKRRRHAHLDGFDLHADTAVQANDRARLGRLCRYLLRPPIASDRLSSKPDGRLLFRLKKPWRDGTRHILFEPIELLEKLAALVPRLTQTSFSTTVCCHPTPIGAGKWLASERWLAPFRDHGGRPTPNRRSIEVGQSSCAKGCNSMLSTAPNAAGNFVLWQPSSSRAPSRGS